MNPSVNGEACLWRCDCRIRDHWLHDNSPGTTEVVPRTEEASNAETVVRLRGAFGLASCQGRIAR